jgi:hypothetical protein
MRKINTQTSWRSWARLYANVSGRACYAYRTADKMVRYTIDKWPMEGQFLGFENPSEVAK